MEQYENKDNKIKLMKFLKKIYYYITKTLNITMKKDLIDEEKYKEYIYNIIIQYIFKLKNYCIQLY